MICHTNLYLSYKPLTRQRCVFSCEMLIFRCWTDTRNSVMVMSQSHTLMVVNGLYGLFYLDMYHLLQVEWNTSWLSSTGFLHLQKAEDSVALLQLLGIHHQGELGAYKAHMRRSGCSQEGACKGHTMRTGCGHIRRTGYSNIRRTGCSHIRRTGRSHIRRTGWKIKTAIIIHKYNDLWSLWFISRHYKNTNSHCVSLIHTALFLYF